MTLKFKKDPNKVAFTGGPVTSVPVCFDCGSDVRTMGQRVHGTKRFCPSCGHEVPLTRTLHRVRR